MALAQILTFMCLAAVAGLLNAEKCGLGVGRVVFKLGASSAFVGVALALGASESVYGRWILGALVLGWLGDAFLLSDRPINFLIGLAAFLLSHACFAAAFVTGDFSLAGFALTLLASIVLGAIIVRWLWPHLSGAFKPAVLAYVTVIFAMCATAVGYAIGTGHWLPWLGAWLFAASDIYVAREKFVEQAYANKAWGLPIYFVAQLLLAWSTL